MLPNIAQVQAQIALMMGTVWLALCAAQVKALATLLRHAQAPVQTALMILSNPLITFADQV